MRSQIKTVIGVAAMIMLLGAIAIFLYKGKLESHRNEYEGIVVEKWAGYNHTEEGSFPYYRLLIESDDGGRFPVPVDYQIYQRAETGSRIKKSKLGIELSPKKNAVR
jgi:hypothetical protein